MGATATYELDTEKDKDAQSVFERAQKINEVYFLMAKKYEENEHLYHINEYYKEQINVALFSNVQCCNFLIGTKG